MTKLDWILVAFTLLLALYGYAQGFLVGALSLVGFVAGAVVGTRLGPALLPEGRHSPYAPLFGLLGALIAGGILATGLEGLAWAVRRRVRGRAVDMVDGTLGAALTACVALGIAWIASAVVLQTPGTVDLRRAIQRSAILRGLNSALPPSGPILHALARLDPVPRVTGPPVTVGPPTSAIARDPQVRAAATSVVRIQGTACGLGVEGSGWVAAPGIVVTNAHVVAGTNDAVAQARGTGSKLSAEPIHFDVTNDVAVLRVRGLDQPPLRLSASAASGTSGAVLGFPEDGPYDVEPARLGETRRVISQDAYGRGPVTRSIASLRARVRPGNSGGPMVDASGRVLTTVFATTVGSTQRGGYGVPDDVVRRALGDRGGPVSTGPCVR